MLTNTGDIPSSLPRETPVQISGIINNSHKNSFKYSTLVLTKTNWGYRSILLLVTVTGFNSAPTTVVYEPIFMAISNHRSVSVNFRQVFNLQQTILALGA